MLAFLWKYIKENIGLVLINVAFVVAQIIIQTVFLMKEMKNIIDNGVEMQDMQYIYSSGARMIGFTLLASACTVVAAYFSAKVVAKVTCRVREDCFKKIASMSPQDFAAFGESTLLTRTITDGTQIQILVINFMRTSLMVPINIICMLFLIFRINRVLFWILFVTFVITITILFFMGARSKPLFEFLQKKVDHISMLMKEKITGVRSIRAFGNEFYEEEKMKRANEEAYDVAISANAKINYLSPLSLVLMNWAVVLIYLAASSQLRAKMASISDLLLIFQYLAYFIASLAVIPVLVNLIPKVSVSIKRIRELLEYPSLSGQKADVENADHAMRQGGMVKGVYTEGSPDRRDVKKLPNGGGEVVFDDVIFGYAGATDVIAHVSFTAEAGKTTAIIGTTGSGKSTLMYLLMGFYAPTFGDIRVDGVSIRSLDMDDYRKNLSFAPQKSFCFNDTVRANITMYDETMSDERVSTACAASCFDEVLEKMPEGYDTVMAQGGKNVSGGQRQRLSLARTVAKEARIYLFDDSFSALDAQTESIARERIMRMLSGKTVLIVAQKISTIREADRIIVMDKGRIAGTGTHEELLRDCEEYRAIYETQSYISAGDENH